MVPGHTALQQYQHGGELQYHTPMMVINDQVVWQLDLRQPACQVALLAGSFI
jgi:hypothetical protein